MSSSVHFRDFLIISTEIPFSKRPRIFCRRVFSSTYFNSFSNSALFGRCLIMQVFFMHFIGIPTLVIHCIPFLYHQCLLYETIMYGKSAYKRRIAACQIRKSSAETIDTLYILRVLLLYPFFPLGQLHREDISIIRINLP